MNLHIHLCVLTKQIPTSCILYAIDSRGVHRSGGSGLCPTRNWPVRDWVGRNPTRSRPVKRVRFRMSVCQQVASVSSEDETQWKTPKNGQNRQNLTRSGQDLVRISSKPMIFPSNRAENRRIWCIYAKSNCFGRRNLPNQIENSSESLENSPKFDVFGWVEFHGFWRRGLETDPPALSFGAQDPCLTAKAVGMGERRSSTGELGEWPGGLDNPNWFKF